MDRALEVDFIAKAVYIGELDMTLDKDERHQVALEWIKETYPEFYDVEINNIKEDEVKKNG